MERCEYWRLLQCRTCKLGMGTQRLTLTLNVISSMTYTLSGNALATSSTLLKYCTGSLTSLSCSSNLNWPEAHDKGKLLWLGLYSLLSQNFRESDVWAVRESGYKSEACRIDSRPWIASDSHILKIDFLFVVFLHSIVNRFFIESWPQESIQIVRYQKIPTPNILYFKKVLSKNWLTVPHTSCGR